MQTKTICFFFPSNAGKKMMPIVDNINGLKCKYLDAFQSTTFCRRLEIRLVASSSGSSPPRLSCSSLEEEEQREVDVRLCAALRFLLIRSLILFISIKNNRNQTPGNVCQGCEWKALMRRLHMWMMKYA